MTTKEINFVQKWAEMLKAAKEMEEEGCITTDFGFTLRSNDNYGKERQLIALELDKGFIENGYNIVR